MWKLSLLVLAACAIVLVACGDDDDEGDDQAAADQAVCDSLAEFGTAVTALQELQSSEPTQEEVDAAMADVRQTWAQFVEDAADSDAKAAAETLELTYTTLDVAVGELPTDVPTTQVQAAIAEELTAVINAYTEINSDLDCGS